MKKTLYSTTLLATAGLLALSAGDAFAQAAAPAAEKMKISVGGFMLQTLGYASQDGDFEDANNTHYKGFDTKSDSEVYFRGSVKLDNGLTVGVDIQLEADVQSAASVVLDESYLTVGSTTVGVLTLGSDDGAGFDLGVQAPWTGAVNPYNGDMTRWIIDPGTAADDISSTQAAGGGNDDNLVKYISPSLAGFRAGASYAASTTDSATQPTVSQVDQWETGLQYSGKFGDFGVRASAIYWNQQGATNAAQLDGFAVGTNLTFADFTVGGAYGETNDAGDGTFATSSDTDTWNIGVRYAPGPLTLALTYGRQTAPNTVADTDDDTHNRIVLGANYALGPGVTLKSSVIRLDFEDEAGTAAGENTGWAAIGGLQVDF